MKIIIMWTYVSGMSSANYNYTANVYRQMTDKLMFKSVISTVR